MTTDDFTEAARAEAERRNPPIDRHPDDFTYPRAALREHKRAEFKAGAVWARAHLAAEVRKAKAEAWDEGALKAWAVSTVEVNGQRYHWRKSGEPRNPYRSCGHPNHGGADHDCRPFKTGGSDEHR